MIAQFLSVEPEYVTQLFIGIATIVITGVSYINSRRAAKMAIYQTYLNAWHELNNIRIQQAPLRSLVAQEEWPDDRSDQILLEAFVLKYLNILSLSYQGAKFGALSHSEFVADVEDVVRELGFLAQTAKRFIEIVAFAGPVKREFNRAFSRRYKDT